MREAFTRATDRLLDEQSDLALVLAEIGVANFRELGTFDRHADRVFNVGIREQLQVGLAAGLAKEGFRPLVHTYAPFLLERPFEQLKLDFGHQGLGGVFVSVGASYDAATSGRTHQAPEDVALLSSLPSFEIHVPGHPGEVEGLLEHAVRIEDSVYLRLSEERNRAARDVDGRRMVVERKGSPGSPVVIAVGPKLDPTLEAVSELDVTVLYTTTVVPFDTEALLSHVSRDVVVVEPYLAGTSAASISRALINVPHRLLSLGVARRELRNYGTVEDHNRAHGLDPESLRSSIKRFLWHGRDRAWTPGLSLEAV